jgi:hypothetical protein
MDTESAHERKTDEGRVQHVTVHQIHQLVYKGGLFVMEELASQPRMAMVWVVGVIQITQEQDEQGEQVRLEDGTGELEVWSEAAVDWKIWQNHYVRLIGTVVMHGVTLSRPGVRRLQLRTAPQPVTDYNEISFHMLACIAEYKRLEMVTQPQGPCLLTVPRQPSEAHHPTVLSCTLNNVHVPQRTGRMWQPPMNRVRIREEDVSQSLEERARQGCIDLWQSEDARWAQALAIPRVKAPPPRPPPRARIRKEDASLSLEERARQNCLAWGQSQRSPIQHSRARSQRSQRASGGGKRRARNSDR